MLNLIQHLISSHLFLSSFNPSLRARGGVISRKRRDRHDHYVVSRKQLGEDDDKSVTEDESFFIPPPPPTLYPPLWRRGLDGGNPPSANLRGGIGRERWRIGGFLSKINNTRC